MSIPETQTPDYMTVGEVAKQLGVVSETVRWWTRTGRLACARTRSGVRLIDRRDVETLALQRRNKGQAPQPAASTAA